MDFKDLFKLQFMSSSLNNGHSTTAPGGFDLSKMVPTALMFLLTLLVEEFLKHLPAITAFLKERYVTNYLQQTVSNTISRVTNVAISEKAVALDTRHFLNSVRMSRVYVSEITTTQTTEAYEETNAMVDAVLAQVSRLENVPSFQLIDRGRILVNYKDTPIQMTKDIYLQLDGTSFGATTGQINRVNLTLLSNTIPAAEIARYVRSVYDLYKEDLKNALGDVIYFFDQKHKGDGMDPRAPPSTNEIDRQMQVRMRIASAPKQLTFAKSPFYSNKTFDNLYGEQVREVKQRVEFFVNNREWYDSRGIPYQLGLLLSGASGAGKTSLLRAIANYTKRHIVNVNFANVATASQLRNLFFSEKLHTYTDSSMGETHSYFIPIDQRIYVLEEIDAIGNIVLQRTADQEQSRAVPDELTLAEILTTLDGTMESPGRIVVMTSNHPEKLDAALIRPGRIDVSVHFTNASRQLIAEMYNGFYMRRLPEEYIPRLPHLQLSPAEVGKVLFRHFGADDVEQCVHDLCVTAQQACEKVQTTKEPVADVAPVSREPKRAMEEPVDTHEEEYAYPMQMWPASNHAPQVTIDTQMTLPVDTEIQAYNMCESAWAPLPPTV